MQRVENAVWGEREILLQVALWCLGVGRRGRVESFLAQFFSILGPRDMRFASVYFLLILSLYLSPLTGPAGL